MKLEIEDYNQQEQDAIEKLPNRIIEMCRTVLFNSEGYPSRVQKNQELSKFLDVMHETRFEHNIQSFFDGYLTETEFEKFKQISLASNEYSIKAFRKNIVPTGSLLRAVQIFRFIDSLFSFSQKKVFEIGPGSGHLGALCLLNGINYSCTDIAQAFYMHQSHYLNFISNDNFNEALDLDRIKNGCENCHIPWWIFAQLYKRPIPQFNIITCNAALAEMHMNSLKYTLKISSLMLSESEGYFVFESWGYDKYIKSSTINQLFIQNGFELQWNSNMLTVYKKIGKPQEYSTNNNEIGTNHLYFQKPLQESKNKTKWEKHGNSIFKRLFPRQYRQMEIASNLVNLQDSRYYTVENYEPWKSDLGRNLQHFFNTRRNDVNKTDVNKLINFIEQLKKSKNIKSDDEEILAFIGSSYI